MYNEQTTHISACYAPHFQVKWWYPLLPFLLRHCLPVTQLSVGCCACLIVYLLCVRRMLSIWMNNMSIFCETWEDCYRSLVTALITLVALLLVIVALMKPCCYLIHCWIKFMVMSVCYLLRFLSDLNGLWRGKKRLKITHVQDDFHRKQWMKTSAL